MRLRACCSRRGGLWAALLRLHRVDRGDVHATAFFLIPEVGVEQLFEIGAATLFVAAGIVAFLDRRLAALAVVVAAACAAPPACRNARAAGGRDASRAAAQNWSPVFRLRGYGYLDAKDARVGVEDTTLRVRFAEDTEYHRLAVVDDETTRYLRFDASLQSAMYLDDPYRTRFAYTDFFHLGLAYNPDARRPLHRPRRWSSPKRMWRDHEDVQIHVVELDPVVVDVGYRYFDVPRDPRLRVEVGDGRQFLTREEKRWDVIVVDAFFADAIPFHRHARVHGDRAGAAGAGWRRRHERHRSARGLRLAPVPLDLPDVPNRLPDGARPPCARGGARAVTTRIGT